MAVERYEDVEFGEELPEFTADISMAKVVQFTAALIHRWAPLAQIQKIDTVFRAPLVVDTAPSCRGVVTDMDDENHVLEIDLTLCNEDGEIRVLGTALVQL